MGSRYIWTGSREHFIDEPAVREVGKVTVGHFGGCSHAGQTKNEDGCLLFADSQEGWEFAVLLDAHKTAESAELIVDRFARDENVIRQLLVKPIEEAFQSIEAHILSVLQSSEFKEACKLVSGETAALFIMRKGKFVWWLSVGDCILLLNHPELASMGEIQLNQRSFYEWIGEANTFELPVPGYSKGVKELRTGRNHIIATTDGLVECPNEPFKEPLEIFRRFEGESEWDGVKDLLHCIQDNFVKDSTTLLSWVAVIQETSTMPSDTKS